MTLSVAVRRDAPSVLEVGRKIPVTDAAGRRIGDAEIELRRNPNTGALEVRAPLTWTGVRRYRHADGTTTRELRRPEQVKSASHLRGLRLLTATADHPSLEDGTPVYLDTRAVDRPTSPDGSALRPPSDYQIGHVGDSIEHGEVDGYYVPIAWVAITDLAAQRMLAAGRTQTSLGYTALMDATPGKWTGPHGEEEYDVEHVLDHDDPRVQQAVDDGLLPTVEMLVDGVIRKVPVLGPNHYAAVIWAGRGEAQSEIRDFAGLSPEAPRVRHDSRDGYVAVIADTVAAAMVSDPRVRRAAATARVDRLVAAALPADVAAYLCTAPLSGAYTESGPCLCGAVLPDCNPACDACTERVRCGDWLGWVAPDEGPCAGGVAFVTPAGVGVWWPSSQRQPDGAVIGEATVFAWRGPAPASVPTSSTSVAAVDDPYPNEHAARQADPEGFVQIRRKQLPNGVTLALGETQSGTWKVQSIRFPAADFTVEAAMAWLAEHDFSAAHFEPASVADAPAAPAAPAAPVPVVDAPKLRTEHAARQAPPGQFDEFLRVDLPNDASMLIARKGDKPWRVQSVRFPIEKWSVADARQWLKNAGLKTSSLYAAEPIGDSVADFAEPVEVYDDSDDVSSVARTEVTPYAHTVHGNVADARLLTMTKIQIPARLADAASAVASAVKGPSPVAVKVADAAMLEVELPEGTDPASLAMAMHALADALTKMTAVAGSAEAAAQEMSADYAAALEDAKAAKLQVDALVADAEVGKSYRLAQVVATAKKAGLTDSDVADKNADQVRVAAVKHQYPECKHLDKREVVDTLWSLIAKAADAQPVPAPAPAAPSIKPAPSRHADSSGDVTAPAKPRVLNTLDFG